MKNRWKKITGLCMAWILIFLAVFPTFSEIRAASVTDPWDGKTLERPDTDPDGVYLIRSGAQLAWFAAEVNKGNGEINGKLENYIYLNDYNTSYPWTMIGDTEEHPYKGSFDGNGQKVVYMRAEISRKDPEKKYAGLFGVIDGGSVKDLTVLGKVIHGYGEYEEEGGRDQLYTGSGGIAGYLKKGQITGCTNYARTTMDGEAMYRNSGGIAGVCKGLIMNCTNEGKLSTVINLSQYHVGGIAGILYGVDAEALNCVNHAVVQGYFCVGGIAGAVKDGAEINTSCNYGEVKGNSTIGGIAGKMSTTGRYSNGTPKECAIRNVYNLGTTSAYGTGNGKNMGGILGEAGYDKWTQEALPPMPVIEQAYNGAEILYTSNTINKRGGVVGSFLSGSYGTIYSIGNPEEINTIGGKNNRAVNIMGEALILKEEQMKSPYLVQKLGKSFVMSGPYDQKNRGFPKLAWQGLPYDLMNKIEEAYLELNGRLTEENRKKYGKNYALIESVVKEYKEKLSALQDPEDLNAIMEEARKKLDEIKPGIEADNELLDAIDDGILSLKEYEKKLLKEHPDLTTWQQQELEDLLGFYEEKLEKAQNIEEVRRIKRDGRDSLDAKIENYEADKRLEEIRAGAVAALTDYRKDLETDVEWENRIEAVREEYLEKISRAEHADEVTKALEEGKREIDQVIDQIPETGAWDGISKKEPEKNKEGVYQIREAEELAWFADSVNNGKDNISGELLNDISLGFQSWKAIGEEGFRGSFDGNGFTVRGLNIDLPEYYTGFFGNLNGGAEQKIQNLSVSGRIFADGRSAYAGGIAGYAEGSSTEDRPVIRNCHSDVTITADHIKFLDAGIGGILGGAYFAAITDCSNQADISLLSAGKGGSANYAGGILGIGKKGTEILGCLNTGTIRSIIYTGGIAGCVIAKEAKITACYNTGHVEGESGSGGILGVVLGEDILVRCCYSSGPVNIERSGRAPGALFGNLTGGSYDHLYALKRQDSLGRALVGISIDFSATGTFLADSELKGDTVINELNSCGNYFIRDYLGFRNGYPVLSWELTMEDLKTGAIKELSLAVKETDYEGEDWNKVQDFIKEGTEQIQNASDMEEVYEILTATKEQIRTVETLAEASERKLQETKDSCIRILENYVDLQVYREEEQTEIRRLLSDGRFYILRSESEEEVYRHFEEVKENIDDLPTAWQYYEQLDLAAAAQADSYILNIGDVVYTAYVKTSIQIARTVYDNLTEKQKNLVTVYPVLEEAEEKWKELEEENEASDEDIRMASETDRLIEAIGTVTKESGPSIRAARIAFDSLTEKQQALTKHPEVLFQAEQAYDEICADPVIRAIAAIGTVTLEKKEAIFQAKEAYDLLTEAQKLLVSDYPALQKAMTTYENLVLADVVIRQIDEIGEVTLDSGPLLTGIINVFNELTGVQQEMVKNYDVLEAAVLQFDSLTAVKNVTDSIERIGVVNRSSGPAIRAAREAYDKLTLQEKMQVENHKDLEAAEAAFEALNLMEPEHETGFSATVPESRMEEVPEPVIRQEEQPAEIMQAPKEQKKAEDPQMQKEEKTEDLPEPQAEEKTEEPEMEPEEILQKEIYKKDVKTEQEKFRIRILLTVLGICVSLTVLLSGSMFLAAKKRKEKLLHY